MKLVIGNRNTSSWSLRAWLVLRQSGLDFEEEVVRFRRPDTAERLEALSPSGKVPVLIDGDLTIWDSLAIAERIAERCPDLWPADPEARAVARSVSAEMHSGFADLRADMPMDWCGRFRRHAQPRRRLMADIDRILAIWADCRQRFGDDGPMLFGDFSIADAMFAPVASRFVTYDVPLDRGAAAYVKALLALPAVVEWGEAAAREVAGRDVPEERPRTPVLETRTATSETRPPAAPPRQPAGDTKPAAEPEEPPVVEARETAQEAPPPEKPDSAPPPEPSTEEREEAAEQADAIVDLPEAAPVPDDEILLSDEMLAEEPEPEGQPASPGLGSLFVGPQFPRQGPRPAIEEDRDEAEPALEPVPSEAAAAAAEEQPVPEPQAGRPAAPRPRESPVKPIGAGTRRRRADKPPA